MTDIAELDSELAAAFQRSWYEKIRKKSEDGTVYWSARDLIESFGYSNWQSFKNIVERAKIVCKNYGQAVDDHFNDIVKMEQSGSDSTNEVEDIRLSRYAVSLIFENADPLTVEELTYLISQIEALDLSSVEIDYLKDLLSPIMKGHAVSTPSLPSGLQLYRGRLVHDKPLHVRELSYPPANYCLKYGRVNRVGQTVFYCSTTKEAVFFEVGCKVGDTLVVSRWKTTRALLVNNVGYTKQIFQQQGSNRDCPHWGNWAGPILRRESWTLVNEFLASTFTRVVPKGQEYLYKLSIAIAEKYILDDLFDGLLYPTIAMKANADNLALKPTYVDKHLLFERVEYYTVDKVTDLGFEATPSDLATSFTPEGIIEWKGRRGHWKLPPGKLVTATSENGRWVVRDEQENILEDE